MAPFRHKEVRLGTVAGNTCRQDIRRGVPPPSCQGNHMVEDKRSRLLTAIGALPTCATNGGLPVARRDFNVARIPVFAGTPVLGLKLPPTRVSPPPQAGCLSTAFLVTAVVGPCRDYPLLALLRVSSMISFLRSSVVPSSGLGSVSLASTGTVDCVRSHAVDGHSAATTTTGHIGIDVLLECEAGVSVVGQSLVVPTAEPEGFGFTEASLLHANRRVGRALLDAGRLYLSVVFHPLVVLGAHALDEALRLTTTFDGTVTSGHDTRD